MTEITEETAKTIVNAIFSELGGRRGVGQQMDMIHDDDEVYQEMHQACVVRTIMAATAGPGKWDDRWDPTKPGWEQ